MIEESLREALAITSLPGPGLGSDQGPDADRFQARVAKNAGI